MNESMNDKPGASQWLTLAAIGVGIILGGFFLVREVISIAGSGDTANPGVVAPANPANNPPNGGNPGTGDLSASIEREKQFTLEAVQKRIDNGMPTVRNAVDPTAAENQFAKLERDISDYLKRTKATREQNVMAKGGDAASVAAMERQIGEETNQKLDRARGDIPTLGGTNPGPANPPPARDQPPVKPSLPPLTDAEFEKLKAEVLAKNIVQELAPFTSPGVYDPAMGRSINDLDPKPVSLTAIKGSGALEESMDGLYILYKLVTDRNDKLRPRWPMVHRLRTTLEQDLEARGRLRSMQEALIEYGTTLVRMENLSP